MRGMKRVCIFVIHKSRMVLQHIRTIPRAMGFRDKNFQPLKDLEEKFSGKRCFILCTGPSLTVSDIELLKDEYTFGMNSLCLLLEQTTWRPDFFAVQDENVYEKVKEYMLTMKNSKVFVPDGLDRNAPAEWIKFPLCGAYHKYELIYDTRYFARFSDKCYVRVYDGYSITYSLIQLAVFMGFKEIYLLGADCNYLGEKQHIIEHGHIDPGFAKAPERMFASYKEAKRYMDNHDVKIYNATRGGMLEIFPRVSLENVLSVSGE